MDSLQNVYSYCKNMLQQRFERRVITNEDSIRYIFFFGLNKYLQIGPNDIVVEYPHNQIKDAKIDTYFLFNNRGFTYEFKYDRIKPNSNNSARPRQAGQIFSDLYKLNLFDEERSRKFLFYITDNEMQSYFNNRKSKLFDFFNLKIGHELTIMKGDLKNEPKTFHKFAGPYVNTIKIKSCFDTKIGEKHWMKVYELVSLSVNNIV